MKKTELAMSVARRLGVAGLLDRYWGPERVTVLAHHRINDAALRPDFPYYQPIVSATPAMFEEQLAYIADHFNVISLDDLVRAAVADGALPPRPLLITFDDGFLDNYTNAYPTLKRYGFPAVIFLMTSRMAHSVPAWWDECAYYFHHTTLESAELPLLGSEAWPSPALRLRVRNRFIHQLKQIPEQEKLAAIQTLGEVLQVEPPPVDPSLFMTWDQVRELVNNGIACMPHTVSHPILARSDEAQQRYEILESRNRVRDETGQEVVAFAYPNGGAGDYDRTTLGILREAGYRVAFTLTPGPARPAAIKERPLEIQRVYLGGRDSMDRFVFKMMGAPMLGTRPSFVE